MLLLLLFVRFFPVFVLSARPPARAQEFELDLGAPDLAPAKPVFDERRRMQSVFEDADLAALQAKPVKLADLDEAPHACRLLVGCSTKG